ncbi:MAG: prolyl oligopeptidase family serine peptidase, partial [Gemmatimonadota bacterium]
MEKLYAETPEAGNEHRADMLQEVRQLLASRRRQSDRRRRRFFRPDTSSLEAYETSTAEYRAQLRALLGWPLVGEAADGVPGARVERVARDDLGTICRVWVETLPGVHTYGLYFRPPGRGPFPLVISQHGGGGTPELCSGFFGSANYNDMTRRVLRRGVAVFAPQLLLWNPESFGPPTDKDAIDRGLKQVGGSLAALELFRLARCLDYLQSRREVDGSRLGMIGLSYGGFYTLFAAALDPRLRVAVSSCFFSDRRVYDLPDWVWFDAAHRFLDYEVAALICPRPLCVEVGERDDLFRVRHARPEARKLLALYEGLGIADRCRYREHPGTHELDREDGGIDFL